MVLALQEGGRVEWQNEGLALKGCHLAEWPSTCPVSFLGPVSSLYKRKNLDSIRDTHQSHLWETYSCPCKIQWVIFTQRCRFRSTGLVFNNRWFLILPEVEGLGSTEKIKGEASSESQMKGQIFPKKFLFLCILKMQNWKSSMFFLALRIIFPQPTPEEQCARERSRGAQVLKCCHHRALGKSLISLYLISHAIKCQPYTHLIGFFWGCDGMKYEWTVTLSKCWHGLHPILYS